MAQIYSQKLWNHVNYHTNSANLSPEAVESLTSKLTKLWNRVNYHTNGAIYSQKLWNHVNYHTNGANL
jgi:hypothetical protein